MGVEDDTRALRGVSALATGARFPSRINALSLSLSLSLCGRMGGLQYRCSVSLLNKSLSLYLSLSLCGIDGKRAKRCNDVVVALGAVGTYLCGIDGLHTDPLGVTVITG